MKRRIIRIDEDRCTGCGLCMPNCPEGALKLIDGKARIVGDILCDGLGACIGHCPEGAITIEVREADPYDERKVLGDMVRQGPGVVQAHLAHLRNHSEWEHLGEAVAYLAEKGIAIPPEFRDARHAEDRPLRNAKPDGFSPSVLEDSNAAAPDGEDRPSRLRNWPVQISLVPSAAPFLDGADVLIAADCVPFAYAEFHEDFLAGKMCLIGCPKLDDAGKYIERLAATFSENDIRSVSIVHMEVPCCYGMVRIVESAIARSGKRIPLATRIISVKGELARRI